MKVLSVDAKPQALCYHPQLTFGLLLIPSYLQMSLCDRAVTSVTGLWKFVIM